MRRVELCSFGGVESGGVRRPSGTLHLVSCFDDPGLGGADGIERGLGAHFVGMARRLVLRIFDEPRDQYG